MRQLSSRQWDILSCLMTDPFSTFTAKHLARKLGVSERTVRYEVAELADFLAEQGIALRRVPHAGISIAPADVARAAEFMHEARPAAKARVYLSAEQRAWTIIAALLDQSCPHTFSSLAHALGVSKASVSRDMRSVEAWFAEHGVNLQVKEPTWYELNISGFMRRQLMVDVLSSGKGRYAGYFASQQTFADTCILERATAALDTFLADKNLSLTDDAHSNLSYYLAVTVFRVSQGHILKSYPEGFEPAGAPDYPALQTLFIAAGLTLAPDTLTYEASMFDALLQAAPRLKAPGSTSSRAGSADRITRQLLTAASAELDYDLFQDTELIESLKVHMQALLVREHLGLQAKCELLPDIQSKFANLFAICKRAMDRIQADYGLTATTDEIALIVMYLGASLERGHRTPLVMRSTRVALVCGAGVGTTTYLARSLAKEFPHLTITAKLSARASQDFNFDQTDLVLTTIDLPRPLPRPTIRVSPMLSRTDIRKIEAHLHPPVSGREEPFVQEVLSLVRTHCAIRDEAKLEQDLRDLVGVPTTQLPNELPGLLGLNDLISDEFIQLNLKCTSWQDAVAQASKPLLDTGFMTEDYYQGILRFAEKYEQFGLIMPPLCAPHTEPDARNHPAISVATLASPVEIKMDGEAIPISVVMVLCLQTPAAHAQALDELFSLVDQFPAFIPALSSAKTPAQFMATISSYCQLLKQ